MKHLIFALSIFFFLVSCTSATSSSGDSAPAQGQDSHSPKLFPTPTPVDRERILARSLEYSYSTWQKEVAALVKEKKPRPESLILANEFLLGQALRGTPYLTTPDGLLIIRADFKTRQGLQSEADFLPLAKKILEKN